MKVSIIIPTYNRRTRLERCLSAIESQTMPKQDFEVIVVNDGSKDDTASFLEEFRKKSSLNLQIMNIQNSGPAKARNAALSLARAGFIAFTDDDCVPESNWIKELLDAFPDDPRCAGTGGKISGYKSSLLSDYIDQFKPLDHVIKDNNLKYLVTANAIYRKSILKEIGGFETSFSWPGGEDPEMSLRIDKLGYYFHAVDGARVYHEHRATIRDIFKTQFNYGRGMSNICQLHNEPEFQVRILRYSLGVLRNSMIDFFRRKGIGIRVRFLYWLADCAVTFGFLFGYINGPKLDERSRNNFKKLYVNKKKQQFFIRSFGCSRRDIDGERIKNYLLTNGLIHIRQPEHADYLIIITCGLTQEDTDKAIECIEEFKQYPGKLLVYGCLPAMDPDAVNSVYNGRTLSTREIGLIDDIFDLPFKFRDIDDANTAFEAYEAKCEEPVTERLPVKYRIIRKIDEFKYTLKSRFGKELIENIPGGIGFDNRFFSLRISVGCVGNCSYCVIKKAIGPLQSKPVPVILKELGKAVDAGQYGINLLSSDSGSYGMDTDSTFPRLLKAILNENKRIYITYIQDLNPLWICRYKDEMVELVKGRRIKSMLSPIQSGNERILKLMNRYSKTDEILNTFYSLRKAYPRLRIRTQVIVGFPTETEEEFEDTIAVLQKFKFDEVDIFPYYEVKGSSAEKIHPKVPEEVISRRIIRLQKSLTMPYRILSTSKYKKHFIWYYKESNIVQRYSKVKLN